MCPGTREIGQAQGDESRGRINRPRAGDKARSKGTRPGAEVPTRPGADGLGQRKGD